MLGRIFSMDTMWTILLVMYIPACIFLIGIVLLQKGKGTGFAGAFGVGGGSDAVFGPRSTQRLHKATYLAATLFMVIAFLMSIIAGRVTKGNAPDLIDTTQAELSATTSALTSLGLGTSVSGGVDTPPEEESGAVDLGDPASDVPSATVVLGDPTAVDPGGSEGAETPFAPGEEGQAVDGASESFFDDAEAADSPSENP